MTTENRRIPFEPRAFLAALGLALALSPTAANAAYFSVSAVSTAPASVDATSQNVPVLYVDLTPDPGPASLGSIVTLNLFGEVPSNLLSATLWRDEGADGFSVALDTPVASAAFAPPNDGYPPRAMLGTISEPALTGGTTRYYFTVSFNGVPPARKMSFGFQMFTDFSSTPNDLQLPFISSPTVARTVVFAKPSDGGFATPTAGTTSGGGLDTGLFVRSGQRVRTETVPGDQWDVSSLTDADGIPATNEGLGAFDRGALVGRIGAGAWQLLGQSSTITATSNGTLYVAANDANYSNNSGFVRALFAVLPSTTPKIWLGGTLGFETSADINQNWAGGRPFDGEHVVFDSSAYDCDWNLPNMALASLSVSTAYLGSFRLTQPPYHWSNRLLVEGDATIQGGLFSVGAASATQPNSFGVKGRLVVRDTATFDLSGGELELGIGAEVRAGAVLRASGDFNIRRAVPSLPWYLRVDQATVNVTAANVSLDNLDYLDLIDATVVAFDNLDFYSYESSTSPFVRLAASAPRSYVFNGWNAGPSGRSPGVHAVAMPAGSTVIFNGSTAIGSTNFGSPNTVDPNGVVKWIPDGGGSSGFISGTLSGPGGAYELYASTSPYGPASVGLGGGATVSTGIGGYTLENLRSPSTYYLFAMQESGGNQIPFTPAGGFGYPGLLRSQPVFVPSGGSPGSADITVADWGRIVGSFNNASNQAGPVIVESWLGEPNLSTSTRHARGTAGPGYSILTLSSSPVTVFAFVDANNNGAWDVFEASVTVTGVNVGPSVQTPVGGFTIVGGNAAPGGSVTLSTQAVHVGAIGRKGPNALIRTRLTSSGGSAQFSALRVRYQGGPLPGFGSAFSVWADDGDGIFNPGPDSQRGNAPINTNGPSTFTISFFQPAFLPSGAPKDFFVVLDLAGSGLMPGATAGVLLDAATSFVLSAGSLSTVPNFPVQTGTLPVLEVVRASETATPELQGGAPTNAHFFPGQMISVISTGTWRTGPSDAPPASTRYSLRPTAAS